MTWQDIPGWFDFSSAYDDVVQHFDGGTLVEVGCFLGRSLAYLAQIARDSGKPFRVVGVDTCLGSGLEIPANAIPQDHHAAALAEGGGTLAGQLHRNLIACGVADLVTLIVSPSEKAAELISDCSVQFCFLDAAHDYTSVKADIRAWLPKLLPGGWLGGDDYGRDGHPNVWPGVLQAVSEMLPTHERWSWDSWRFRQP